jgi:hypothetical protein
MTTPPIPSSNSNENLLDKFTDDPNYDVKKLNIEEISEIQRKVDNFLEALYLAPQLFSTDIIHVLRLREDKLTMWRRKGILIGGISYLSLYGLYKLRSYQSFYFKNLMILMLTTGIISYISGRLSEYIGNKLYYQKVLMKIGASYNITDSEIEDLHLKINEYFLTQNKEEQNQSALNNIKFKI